MPPTVAGAAGGGAHTTLTGNTRSGRSAPAPAPARTDAIVTAIYVAAAILAVVILVAVVTQSASSRSPRVKELLRGAAQNAEWAAQDSNPFMAVLHASHAQAHVAVAREIASDVDIERAAAVRMDEFSQAIRDRHGAAIRSLTAACPALAPAGVAAVHTGWLSQ